MFYNELPELSKSHYSTPLCGTTSQTIEEIINPSQENTETDGLQEPRKRNDGHNSYSFLQNPVSPVVTSQVGVLYIYSLKL